MATGGAGISDRIPEYEALEMSYLTLVEGISRSPGEIVDKLYREFSPDELSELRSSRLGDREKARKIIDIVMNKVKSEPSFYEVFSSTIMEEDTWMKPYVKVLKANFKRVQRSSSTSINEPLIEETVIGNSHSDPLVPTDEPPTLDLYTALDGEEFEHVSVKKKFDESDLENKTENIRQEFASLVTNIAIALKRKGITTDELIFHLSELGSVCSDNTKVDKVCYFNLEFTLQIKKECHGDICKVFDMLRRYYSWINPGLIKSIKNAFCKNDEIIGKNWEEYQHLFKKYCKERVCKIPKPINGIRTLHRFFQKSNTVAFKIDARWQDIRFDRLNNIQASINRLLGLKPYTLYLKTVKQGCVELVFEVPQHVADVIFPPTEEQLQALQENGIKYCGISMENPTIDPEYQTDVLEFKHGFSVMALNSSPSAMAADQTIPTEKEAVKKWRIAAIGERNQKKYEIINGLLGQESIRCPFTSSDITTTEMMKQIRVKVLDMNEFEHARAEKMSKMDSILYFLPENDYSHSLKKMANKCDPKIWKRCIIVVTCADYKTESMQKISEVKRVVEDVLTVATLSEDIVTKFHIVPIYETASCDNHWFSILCWTVLGVSSTASQELIVEIFADRLDPKYKGQTDKLHLQSIDLPTNMLKEAKVVQTGPGTQILTAAGHCVGAALGGLYGENLTYNTVSHGVNMGVGLAIGAVFGGLAALGAQGVFSALSSRLLHHPDSKEVLENYINTARRMVGRKPKNILKYDDQKL